VRLWQSAKAPSQQTLTVVTALSPQRLPMLEAQCGSWPGPLAVVLYEPLVVGQGAAGLNNSNSNSSSSSSSSRRNLRHLLGDQSQFEARLAGTSKAVQAMFDR
jgi:hypothetical protein